MVEAAVSRFAAPRSAAIARLIRLGLLVFWRSRSWREQPHRDQQIDHLGKLAQVEPGAFRDPFQSVVGGVHVQMQQFGGHLGVQIACDVRVDGVD